MLHILEDQKNGSWCFCLPKPSTVRSDDRSFEWCEKIKSAAISWRQKPKIQRPKKPCSNLRMASAFTVADQILRTRNDYWLIYGMWSNLTIPKFWNVRAPKLGRSGRAGGRYFDSISEPEITNCSKTSKKDWSKTRIEVIRAQSFSPQTRSDERKGKKEIRKGEKWKKKQEFSARNKTDQGQASRRCSKTDRRVELSGLNP